MNDKIRFLIRIPFIFIVIAIVLATIFFWIIDYESFVFQVLSKFGKLDKLQEFKDNYLSLNRFYLIRGLLLFFTFSLAVISYKWYRLFEIKLINFLNFSFHSIKVQFKSMDKVERFNLFFVFIILTIIKLYYAFTFKITNDEAFTFYSYVKNGFFAAISYYNLTNNHILHSIFCNFTDLLPISPIYTLRIPSLIVGSINIVLSFLFFRRIFSRDAALFAFIIFIFIPVSIEYNFLASGYSFLLMFTLFSALAMLEILKSNPNRKYFWAIYIISTALGFYSIPIYIYIFVSFSLFYLLYSLSLKQMPFFSMLKEYSWVSMIIVLIVSVLYLPVVLVSGLSSLLGNEYVLPQNFNLFLIDLLKFIPESFLWFFNENLVLTSIFAVFILVSLIYTFVRNKLLFFLILSFLVGPFLFTLLQRVVPLPRLFIFELLILSISGGFFIELIQEKVKIFRSYYFVSLLCVLFSISFLFEHHQIIQKKAFTYNLAYTFVDKIESNSSVFMTFGARYYTFLKFKSEYLDKKVIELTREGFDKTVPYTYIAETKQDNENWVKLSNFEYNLIHNDEYIKLYKLVK